ncbi:MAG: VIT1/CCC1 transporter family protein [Acidimicrobiales bacterium]
MAHDLDHSHSHMVHVHRDVQGGAERAAIFGVSDGLVSNVALILGVAAAAEGGSSVVIAGLSGLLAGAASMAAGEYVSMKAQAELVERELERERESLATNPGAETRELAKIYESRGVDPEQARDIAKAVMADPEVALEVHAREELGVNPDEVGNPVLASVSSFVAFAIGALLPLLPWFFTEGNTATIYSVLVGLGASAAVGVALASFTKRSAFRTAARQVILAAAACAATFAVGSLLGATVV